MYSISSSLSLSFVSPRALSVVCICIYKYKCIRVQRNIKKSKESNVHTHIQHAWKPLVERGMHIETNKHAHIHTIYVFISSETTNKNKNGRKKKQKKSFLTKK